MLTRRQFLSEWVKAASKKPLGVFAITRNTGYIINGILLLLLVTGILNGTVVQFVNKWYSIVAVALFVGNLLISLFFGAYEVYKSGTHSASKFATDLQTQLNQEQASHLTTKTAFENYKDDRKRLELTLHTEDNNTVVIGIRNPNKYRKAENVRLLFEGPFEPGALFPATDVIKWIFRPFDRVYNILRAGEQSFLTFLAFQGRGSNPIKPDDNEFFVMGFSAERGSVYMIGSPARRKDTPEAIQVYYIGLIFGVYVEDREPIKKAFVLKVEWGPTSFNLTATDYFEELTKEPQPPHLEAKTRM